MMSLRTRCAAFHVVTANYETRFARMVRWRDPGIVGHTPACIPSCLLETRRFLSYSPARCGPSSTARPRTGSKPSSSSGAREAQKKQRAQVQNDPQSASTTQQHASSREAMQTSQLRGGFNRMVREKGLYTALFTYFTGESVTLFLTYLLYCNVFGTGDIATLLQYANLSTTILENGITVWGYKLTLRLLADYIIANIIVTPLRPLHARACSSFLSVMSAVISKTPLGALRTRKTGVPKAPTTKPSDRSGGETTKKAPPHN